MTVLAPTTLPYFCRILPYSASYNILLNSASYILLSSASYILPSPASYILLSSVSYISALAALAISYSLLTQPLTYIRRVFMLTNVSSALFGFAFIIISAGLF